MSLSQYKVNVLTLSSPN